MTMYELDSLIANCGHVSVIEAQQMLNDVTDGSGYFGRDAECLIEGSYPVAIKESNFTQLDFLISKYGPVTLMDAQNLVLKDACGCFDALSTIALESERYINLY